MTPAPPRDANDRDALWPLFKAVDRDQSGQLSEAELQNALVNGDWSKFDPHTVRMMIRMFDADRNGTINFDEFWYVTLFFSFISTLQLHPKTRVVAFVFQMQRRCGEGEKRRAQF